MSYHDYPNENNVWSFHSNLSDRKKWQDQAAKTGHGGENAFAIILRSALPAHYEVVTKPPKLQVYSEGRGIVLDLKVINKVTGKCLYIEKKTGNNGGNAHERVYKYLSESLKRRVRRDDPTLVEEPFFLVFSGHTFQGQKYQDEINLLLEDSNYAIMEPDFANIDDVASKIMEIV